MKKKIVVQAVAVLLLIITCVGIWVQKEKLYDQQANVRWSEEGMAQISVFYPVTQQADELFAKDLSHRIENALEKSAVADSLNPDKKTGLSFPYAFSNTGTLELVNSSNKLEVDVIGVEGDFFLFHPIALIGGSYISDDDIMDDGIIIDEDTAWKLFGSCDVVGMNVNIRGIPFYVKGVYAKADDRFSLEAGLDKCMCYVNLERLKTYGTVTGSYSYETILPNPVDNFAFMIISEIMGDGPNSPKVIENSSRYSMSKLREVIKQIGIRSMSTDNIAYPYYENIARAWEDIFALLLIWQVLLVLIAAVILFFEIRCLQIGSKIKNIKKRGKILWENIREHLASRLP